MNIGIDASRNRSGGAKAHIIGILNELEQLPNEISEIHIWSYESLLDLIPNRKWLIKHSSIMLEKSLIFQALWQFYLLPIEAKKFKIDLMLNTDAGSISPYHPSVSMSRDMLSYEEGEINRFGFGLSKLRLYILRFTQNYRLRKSEGVIFLTEYASKIIQKSCGPIENYAIIPHGVSNAFRISSNNGIWLTSSHHLIKCIYVSNVAEYKHQWNVVKAISLLKTKGYNIYISFIGGGKGKAQNRFVKEVSNNDPKNEFIKQIEFVNHDQIPGLLKEADIFIFASSCENMPNTLVEGMSTGLPIACSNRGPMPDILLDGGVYFDPEDYQTIATSIEEIINNEELRIRLSKRAKELSQQYSWSRCANETINYLIQVHKKSKLD